MGFANRGKYAEDKAHAYLQWWAGADPHCEASRLVDTKAAGRIIKAAKADFEYFTGRGSASQHGLIETKQTEHDYRLERAKVTQLPNLRKREKCGGRCYVLVYHSTIKAWRCLSVPYLVEGGDKGSWNLSAVPTFPTCWQALGDQSWVFPPWAK